MITSDAREPDGALWSSPLAEWDRLTHVSPVRAAIRMTSSPASGPGADSHPYDGIRCSKWTANGGAGSCRSPPDRGVGEMASAMDDLDTGNGQRRPAAG